MSLHSLPRLIQTSWSVTLVPSAYVEVELLAVGRMVTYLVAG